MKIIEGISYYPITLHYLIEIDKTIPVDKYKPASYDQWIMLKELEPTKFGYDYQLYINLKEKEFNEEVESLKNCAFKLETITIAIDIRVVETIEKLKNKIKEIETNVLFNRWLNPIEVKDLLTLQL